MRVTAAWHDLKLVEGEGFFGSMQPAVRELAIRTIGRQAAAQFLWEHRKRLRRGGAFYVHIDTRTQMPKWFGIVVEVILRLPGWRVRTACSDGRTLYSFDRQPKERAN